MAKRKYEKYIIPLRSVQPERRGEYEQQGKGLRYSMLTARNAPEGVPINWFIDTQIIWDGGHGWHYGNMMTRPGVEPQPQLPHAHPVDEVMFFLGTDPEDPYNLHGEFEMWMGEGDDAEQYCFEESTIIFIPRYLAHNPGYVRSANRRYPWINVVTMPNVLGQMALGKEKVDLPKAFKKYEGPTQHD